MAGTYNPSTHTAPATAAVGTANVDGLSPGRVYAALNDQWAPAFVLLPTAMTSDGYPTGMTAFATSTGAVT